MATELLSRADEAAERLGSDANYWTTGFGPTNVELHRLSIALDLGDVVYVVERGPAVPVDHVPAERRVSHLIDLSRALSLTARDDEATCGAASLWLNAGVQPTEVARRLGHSVAVLPRVYANCVDGEQDAVNERIALAPSAGAGSWDTGAGSG